MTGPDAALQIDVVAIGPGRNLRRRQRLQALVGQQMAVGMPQAPRGKPREAGGLRPGAPVALVHQRRDRRIGLQAGPGRGGCG